MICRARTGVMHAAPGGNVLLRQPRSAAAATAAASETQHQHSDTGFREAEGSGQQSERRCLSAGHIHRSIHTCIVDVVTHFTKSSRPAAAIQLLWTRPTAGLTLLYLTW
eukprot:6199705-Pleurochrysis_carterae.AAC.3